MGSALTLDCSPRQEDIETGQPVLVDIRLRNDGETPLTLSAVGVPWMFHGAIRFAAEGLEASLPVIDPPEATLELPPGGEDGGTIDLAEYLHRPDGTPVNQAPGAFAVTATVTAVVLKAGQDPPYERVPLQCGPFAVTIEG